MGRTAEEWRQANPILNKGVKTRETDTNRFKIGDGITPWNALNYEGDGSGGGGGFSGVGMPYEIMTTAPIVGVPEISWSIEWGTQYSNPNYSQYPGTLPTDNLIDMPPGQYQTSLEVYVNVPLPGPMRMMLTLTASNPTYSFDLRTSHIYHPQNSIAVEAYLNGLWIIPENADTVMAVLYVVNAETTDTNTDPFQVDSVSLKMTKVGDV